MINGDPAEKRGSPRSRKSEVYARTIIERVKQGGGNLRI
jgi:hypothetical protein